MDAGSEMIPPAAAQEQQHNGAENASDERPSKRPRLEASSESAAAATASTDVAMTDTVAPAPAPAPIDASADSQGTKPSFARVKGMAPIKAEYIIERPSLPQDAGGAFDDDAAEGRGHDEPTTDRRDDRRDDRRGNRDRHGKHGRRDRKKEKGQNKDRQFGSVDDAIRLCQTRTFAPEFSPLECRFGDDCNKCHDLRKYLAEGRRDDSGTETFRGGPCPVFEKFGRCYSGWKCRFVKSHMREVEHPDGRKELVLVERDEKPVEEVKVEMEEKPVGEVEVRMEEKPVEKVEEKEEETKEEDVVKDGEAIEGQDKGGEVIEGLDKDGETIEEQNKDGQNEDQSTNKPQKVEAGQETDTAEGADNDGTDARPDVFNVVSGKDKILLSRRKVDYTRTDEYVKWMNKEAELHDTFHTKRRMQDTGGIDDLRARYIDPPFLPSEKRRLYFGPETPVLAPLTTQGNIPFRRLCVEMGAQLTYSEMAMSMHLLQGNKTDWTLLKAHKSELEPPRIADDAVVPAGYDHSRDIRFGAQISATTPWSAVKAADTLTRYCPRLRLIDLNCGCPIDTVFKSGGGSALLDTPNKMERMIRGMNTVSGEVPVTAKIRTGIRSSRPNASAVLGKLAFGSREHRHGLGAPGCAAVTLHGRSREMRYTKLADWSYIAECAALVKTYNEQRATLSDTADEPDARTQPAAGKMFFLGNGDCYSHVDYAKNVAETRVDSVMIGRGALIKPWLFEEIEAGQYLDKTPTERLGYVEKFVRYGLESWGSDEVGVTFTRRFLLEWLSFAHRYVPVGLLEVLPPSLNDRPPPFKGRDEMETLLASPNYRDWIKISEMYLGPVHPGFQFQPKHKSHAYEAEG